MYSNKEDTRPNTILKFHNLVTSKALNSTNHLIIMFHILGNIILQIHVNLCPQIIIIHTPVEPTYSYLHKKRRNENGDYHGTARLRSTDPCSTNIDSVFEVK